MQIFSDSSELILDTMPRVRVSGRNRERYLYFIFLDAEF